VDEMQDICMDHKGIRAVLDPRFSARPKDPLKIQTECLRLDDMEELGHIYKAHVTGLFAGAGWSLTEARRAMMEAALQVLGTKKAATRKPQHRNKDLKVHGTRICTLSNLQHLILEPSMRHTAEEHEQGLAESCKTLTDNQQGQLPENLEGAPLSTLEDIRTCLTDARHLQDAAICELDRQMLQANCDRARWHLDNGKKGMQKAMGKTTAQQPLTALKTTHPNVISLRSQDGMDDALVAIDPAGCTAAASPNTIIHMTVVLDNLATILEAAREREWEIKCIGTNNKDRMAAELYKHAPTEALLPLLNQINACLWEVRCLQTGWGA